MRCYKTIFIALIAVFMFVSCEFDSKNKSTNEVTQTSPIQIPKDADFEYRAAVMDFRPNGNLTHKDVEGISMIFATYFHPEGYSIIERSQIETVLKEQGIQKKDITEHQMIEIGKIMNLAYIVIGDVTLQMNEYNVDVRLVNVETGKIIAYDGASFSIGGDSYRQYIEKIANRLASKVPQKTITYKNVETTEDFITEHFDEITILYGYLKIYPNDIGDFDAKPNTIIAKINEGEPYDYCTWRLPTKEELSLMRSNNIIPTGVTYISLDGSNSGRVRLVTDEEKCSVYKANIKNKQNSIEQPTNWDKKKVNTRALFKPVVPIESDNYIINQQQSIHEFEEEGIIVVDIWVDKNGYVTKAEIGKGTTISNNKQRNDAIQKALSSVFTPNGTSTKGTITYHYVLK